MDAGTTIVNHNGTLFSSEPTVGGGGDRLRATMQSLDLGSIDPTSRILRAAQFESVGDGKNGGGLPAEKGFPIQIGSELFRLSGASIMSDGEWECAWLSCLILSV